MSPQQTKELLAQGTLASSYSRSNLPTLPLWSFCGNPADEQWFYNCFMSRADNDLYLSTSDKFHYLRSYLIIYFIFILHSSFNILVNIVAL